MRYTIPMTKEQTKDLMREALIPKRRQKKNSIGTDREMDVLHDMNQYLMGMRRALILLGQQDICDISELLDEWWDEEEE